MTVTIHDLRAWKTQGKRFAMLTAYDYPTARILDDAGIPVLLVGDSLANNVLGYENTLPVTMEEMLHHTRAVTRGAREALVVGDMPFLSYQVSPTEALANAGRFIKEGGVEAVKLEGGVHMAETVARLAAVDIPVVGHIGLTPQSVHRMGGHKVQGKQPGHNPGGRERIVSDAKVLESAGACAVVLEGIPRDLAREITEAVSIPTIGIGAGPDCDGQVLVLHDVLGLTDARFKFTKAYAELRGEVVHAIAEYADEVRAGEFPTDAHSFH